MADESEQVEYRIAKLELAPGDVLVVKAARASSVADLELVIKYVEPFVPADCKVLAIDGTVDLSVLTRAEIESRTSEGTAP